MKKGERINVIEPRHLTKAELEIMQILWQRNGAFANEVLEDMAAPKPAYTTVSTVLRVLEQKGVVGYKSYGRSHKYFPLIERESYTRIFMQSVMKNFFGNSLPQMVSFFCKHEDLSEKDRNELLEIAKTLSEESSDV